MFAGWFKQFCTIRFILCVINTGHWFCASRLPFSICSATRRATTVSQCIILTNHKSYFEHILDLKLFFFPAFAALSVSEQVIYPTSIIKEHFCLPPLILMGGEYHWVFLSQVEKWSKKCTSAPPAQVPLQSILLFFSIPSHLLNLFADWRPPKATPASNWTRGQPTFSLIFKVVTHFKLMLQITEWAQREGASGWLSTWQLWLFADCSSNLWHTHTNMHEITPTPPLRSLTDFPSAPALGSTSHPVSGHNFHFRQRSEENYFPISFEFCQNRVSGVSGQHL